MKPQVHIYADGAIHGNPGGIGGYAAVLLARLTTGQTAVLELVGAELNTTNNRMEMMGAIAGLEALRSGTSVLLHSDSQYVIKGMSQWLPGWLRYDRTLSSKKNSDLWLRLLEASRRHTVTWKWVPGHRGVRWNERADELATGAVYEVKQKLKAKVSPCVAPAPGMSRYVL